MLGLVSTSRPTCHFTTLFELQCAIFSHLDLTGLLAAEKVCVAWCRISNDETLWRCIAWQRKVVVTSDRPGLTFKAQVMDGFIPYWKVACQIFPTVKNMDFKDVHPQRALDQEIHKANWRPESAQDKLLEWLNTDYHINSREKDPTKLIGHIQIYLEAGAKIDETLLIGWLDIVTFPPFPACFDVICEYLAHFITVPSTALVFCAVHAHTLAIRLQSLNVIDFPAYLRGLIKKMDDSSFVALIDGMADMIVEHFVGLMDCFSSNDDNLLQTRSERQAAHLQDLQTLSERVTVHLQDIRKLQQQ
ncbi:MAG TPA: F-box-like domain-containing protein [Waddliaceae bacterium]